MVNSLPVSITPFELISKLAGIQTKYADSTTGGLLPSVCQTKITVTRWCNDFEIWLLSAKDFYVIQIFYKLFSYVILLVPSYW